MLIGIVGFISSGKNTIGEILQNQHGFKRESFAKPVKDAVAFIFNWDREMLEGNTDESRVWRESIDEYWSEKLNRQISPRIALQLMGTESGRLVFGENLWTTSCLSRCEDKNANYVITDTRFVNEIQAIKKEGGYIIRIRRGQEPEYFHKIMEWKEDYREQYGDYLSWIDKCMRINFPTVHRSEWEWIGSRFDIILDNHNIIDADYSLATLKAKVHDILGVLKLNHKLGSHFEFETVTI